MGNGTPLRAAVRLARSASCVPLGTAAAALSMTADEMRARLAALEGRGACAQRAAEAALGDASGYLAEPAVLEHRACPPGMRRARPEWSESAAGAAAWHGRREPANETFPVFGVRAVMNRPPSSARADLDLKLAALTNPHCPTAVFERVSDDPDPTLRVLALSTPRGDRLLLARLAADPDLVVRAEAAKSRRCSPQMIARFASDPASGVRAEAASHPNCAPRVLARLAGDPNPTVRRTVASHHLCPAEVLARLAEDADSTVRDSVASNVHTPRSVLERFACDPDPSMRSLVALNTSCPSRTAKALSRDVDGNVRADNEILGAGLVGRAFTRVLARFEDRSKTARMLRAQRGASKLHTPRGRVSKTCRR